MLGLYFRCTYLHCQSYLFPILVQTLLVVTRALTQDDFGGFVGQQALHSMYTSMPDRVLLLFLDPVPDLQPVSALGLLLRDVPPGNRFHVPKTCPRRHPEWARMAFTIIGKRQK